MGFRFRKSASFGSLRINFSKSGVGYSVGGKGFRITKKAGGGVRTTASIPGTGISYVTDHGSKKRPSSSQRAGTRSNANSGTSGKNPFFQRRWFIAVIIIVLLSTMGSACSGDDMDQLDDATSQQEETVLPAENDTPQEEQAAQPSEMDTPDTPEDAEETPAENNTKSPEAATPEESETPDSAVKEQNTSNESSSQQETTSTAAPATPSTSTPVSEPTAQPTPESEPEPEPQTNVNDRTVYVTKTGKRYHYDSKCGNGTYYESTLSQAQARGLTPCQKCAGG